VIAVTAGATWLGASLTGSTPVPAGGSRTLTIAVDTVGLAPGTVRTAMVMVGDPVAADLPQHLFQPAQQITVSIDITPEGAPQIATSGALQAFEWLPAAGAPAQTIAVHDTGDATLNARVTASVPWLRFSWPGGAQTILGGDSAPLGISIDPQLVPGPGTHAGQVTIQDAALPGVTTTFAVTLKVVTRSLFAVAPTQLTFTSPRWTTCNGSWSGGNPAAQGVIITNESDRPVWFLVAPSTVSAASWLAVSPSWGVVPPRHTRTLSVSIDAKRLPQGAHAGALTVYTLTNPSQGHVLDSHVVPVTLNVTPAAPRLCVSPGSLDFGSLKQNVLSAARTITVENAGDGSLTWTATATASSGTATLVRSGSTLRIAIATGSKKGAYTGKVTVSAPGMPSQAVALKWSVTEKKGGSGHHDDDDDDDDDRCHGDHDRDGDHDDRDHGHHRHGHDWD